MAYTTQSHDTVSNVHYIKSVLRTCISYNTGKSICPQALHALGHHAYILGKARVSVLELT